MYSGDEIYGDDVTSGIDDVEPSDPFEGWTIPAGYTPDNLARCRSCRAEVLWTITKAGKRALLDRDGTSHFATCPEATSWRRPR